MKYQVRMKLTVEVTTYVDESSYDPGMTIEEIKAHEKDAIEREPIFLIDLYEEHGGANSDDKFQVDVDVKPVDEVGNICPVCGKEAKLTCKCFRQDSVCEDGHEWHTCTIHHVKVLGKSDHSTNTMSCTCGKEGKKHE